MNRKICVLVLAVLAITLGLSTASAKPIVAVFAKGMLKPDLQLQWIMSNITNVEWKLFTDTITYEDIKDAKMLIVVLVDIDANFTQEEINAIVKWFNEGGKTLWLCGDSDYKGGDYKRIPKMNMIAEAIGTVLRNEHAEAVDRGSNCGKPYRVAALIKPDDPFAAVAAGITRPVLFHGPGIIAAYKDGKWYALEKEVPENVYRIAWTSDQGAVAEFVKPLPEVHDIGYEGKLVVMAAEVFPDKKNIVLYSAEAPFDHYRGMWTTTYHDVELDGPQFVVNIIQLGAYPDTFWTYYSKLTAANKQIAQLESQVAQLKSQVSQLESQVASLQSQLITYLIGGLIIGLIIGIAIGFIVGKKKKS